MPLKIVWFSGVDLADTAPKKSGTWIHSMYKNMKGFKEVSVVANFSFSNVKKITLAEQNGIKQYFVPSVSARKGIINKNISLQIAEILSQLKPDILHIWGTESYWCTLYHNEQFTPYKKLLEIQGLLFFWGNKNVFFAGLTEVQIRKMAGVLEFLYPKMKIEYVRSNFEKWGNLEKKILSSANHINTQSEWIRDIMSIVAPNAKLHKTEIILRDNFLFSEPWSKAHQPSSHPVILTTTSTQPYKGFHVTLRAFTHVLAKYPDAKLRVAGIGIKKPHYRNVGYVNYLLKLIEKYNLKGKVSFLGSLNEEELISEMRNADVFVNSSYVESYCLALAEALSYGIPCVASYTSALTELITDNETGLFYPVGDDYVCATKIISLLDNEEERNRISHNASSLFRERINPHRIANQQIEIYKSLK